MKYDNIHRGIFIIFLFYKSTDINIQPVNILNYYKYANLRVLSNLNITTVECQVDESHRNLN